MIADARKGDQGRCAARAARKPINAFRRPAAMTIATGLSTSDKLSPVIPSVRLQSESLSLTQTLWWKER